MTTAELELLNIEQVSELLQLKPMTIMEHTTGKKLPIIPSIRVNRRIRRYRKSDLAAFIESCAVNSIKAEAK